MSLRLIYGSKVFYPFDRPPQGGLSKFPTAIVLPWGKIAYNSAIFKY